MSAALIAPGAIPGLTHTTANLAGFAGMACIVLDYAYITAARHPNPWGQHGVNLLGAALLTISLLVNTNPASLVLEGFWALIALWGLAKAAFGKKP